MKFTFRDLIRRSDQQADGYSRALQAARVRAAYQRSYFAPALFSLIPVGTDLVDSMAVDAHWRLYYNDGWLARHTVEENATLLIHEVRHLLRDHEARKKAAGITDHRRWNTAGDCEINDDLHAEGLPLPGDPPLPAFRVVTSASCSSVSPCACASTSAVSRTLAGSLRWPRSGTGDRYGLSVSTSSRPRGAAAATSRSSAAFLYVSMPANETCSPIATYASIAARVPTNECITPLMGPYWSKAARSTRRTSSLQ